MGSLLRTADGLGVARVILTGYTPYPLTARDPRLPHEAKKVDALIRKTALGAEASVRWEQSDDIFGVLEKLRSDGYKIIALEQTEQARPLPDFAAPPYTAVVIGREVEGIEPEVIAACDEAVEIPMFGAKESFNVVQAAAMALYHIRFR